MGGCEVGGLVGTVEKVGCGFWVGRAKGAQRGGGDVDEVEIGLGLGAETGAELGEGGAVGAW